MIKLFYFFFFFSSRRRHTRFDCDWSSDVCSSDLGWELELPAGHIENGESPEVCAKRELEEETGYSAGSWKRLGWFHPSPGISSQRAYAYLARKLKRGVLHREPYEFGMEVKTLRLRDAYKRLWRGEIVHSPTASALGIAQPGILRMKRATVSRHS